MSEPISGLHSCKPGNEPTVGAVKTFTVEQRTGKSGKPYTKIKGAPADQGGQPYRIISAKPTGHTDSYGNVSFNIQLEPATGTLPAQQTQPQGRSGAGNGGFGRSQETQSRIERQHSQEMALRYLAMRPNQETQVRTETLRDLIDWFQRDIGYQPKSAVEQQAKTMFNATEAEPHTIGDADF